MCFPGECVPQTLFHSDICSPENISLAYLNVTYHHIATDVICDCSFRNTSQKKFAVCGGTACQTGHCRRLPVCFLLCFTIVYGIVVFPSNLDVCDCRFRKVCPQCNTVVQVKKSVCNCGHVFASHSVLLLGSPRTQ